MEKEVRRIGIGIGMASTSSIASLRKNGSTVKWFIGNTQPSRIMSLDKFAAGDGSEVLRPVQPGDLGLEARGEILTEVLWARIQRYLKGVISPSLMGRSCEKIARLVVTGD